MRPMEERGPSDRWAIDRVTLRFRSRDLERSFQAAFARQNVTNLRIGFALAAVMWVAWGALVRARLGTQLDLDSLYRYGMFIPLALLGLGLTFWHRHQRVWQPVVLILTLATALAWTSYTTQITGLSPDYGYVGLILIQAFAFAMLRLPFTLVTLLDLVTGPTYLALAISSGSLAGRQALLATFFLGSFGVLALMVAYVLEWKERSLFVREQQLDRERERSDSLLLNILPRPIADRLKARGDVGSTERLAQALDEVTVLFVDAVEFTTQAAKTPPDQLVTALDDLFSRMDAIADRFGLEKIKTVGDAYMAVAGAPEPRADHAKAAANMALAICDELPGAKWPTGDPIGVRVGVASGPAVAGVIGRRKFAYDLWGDTVNLASRLQTYGHPGEILISDGTAARLGLDYELGPELVLDIKGRGETGARRLLGRRENATGRPS
jgi:adenylate cyclase